MQETALVNDIYRNHQIPTAISDVDGTIFNGIIMKDMIGPLQDFGFPISVEGWNNSLAAYKRGDPKGKFEVLEYFGKQVMGASTDLLKQITIDVLDNNKNRFNANVLELFANITQQKGQVMLATASGQFIAQAIKTILCCNGINVTLTDSTIYNTDANMNIIEIPNEMGITSVVRSFSDKAQFAKSVIMNDRSVNFAQTYILGDHKDDLDMMAPFYELGAQIICVHPGDNLKRKAEALDWQIYSE